MPLVVKEVIRPGTYFYRDEATGQPRKLVVTPELTKYWHEQGNKMLASGLTVPVPCEHDFQAHPMTPADKLKNNAGWVKGYELRDIKDDKGQTVKDVLFAKNDIVDEDIKKKLPHTIRWTSPWINSFTDGAGREWRNVISHLALTTRPRIIQQEPFGSVAAALSIATEVCSSGAEPDGKGLDIRGLDKNFCLSRAGLLIDDKPAYPIAFSMHTGIPMSESTTASKRQYTRDKAGKFSATGKRLSEAAHHSSRTAMRAHDKVGHSEHTQKMMHKLSEHLNTIKDPNASHHEKYKAHVNAGLYHKVLGHLPKVGEHHQRAAEYHGHAATHYASGIPHKTGGIGSAVAHGAKKAGRVAAVAHRRLGEAVERGSDKLHQVVRAGYERAKSGASRLGGAIKSGFNKLRSKVGLSIGEVEAIEKWIDGQTSEELTDNFGEILFSLMGDSDPLDHILLAIGDEEDMPEGDEGGDDPPPGATPTTTDANADVSGLMDPTKDSNDDVKMEELLCDLLQALGVPMPDESNENEFKRHLYEAAMSKIKELTSKGMGKDATNQAPDQNKPTTQQPNASQPKSGQSNPLIQQEQQPMYMSLDGSNRGSVMATMSLDEINALPDPLKSFALSMYAENQQHVQRVEKAEAIANSLRDKQLKEATAQRTARISLLTKLFPKVKGDLEAMMALPGSAMLLGAGGEIIDPMNQTLTLLEKGLSGLPEMLTKDTASLSLQAHPTDESTLSDDQADAIADSMARHMGATGKKQAS